MNSEMQTATAIMENKLLPSRQRWIAGFGFVHVLLALVYFISDSFTASGFDESVVYLLHTGVDGFETSGYRFLVGSTVLLLVTCLYVCIKIGKSRFLNNPENAGMALGISLALAALLFVQPVFNTLATRPLYDIVTGYEPPVIELKIPGPIEIPAKKNIVYLYLESFERSLLDNDQFPGLAPNLRQLEQQGLSFTNIGAVYGTRWTIAGMVASQCGLPLIPVSDVNKPGSFMPKAVCLGDVLKQNGYTTSYLGGAALQFAGKGNFYRTHGFDTVLGLENHVDNFPLGSKSYSHWGMYDEDLFELAHQELSRLTAQDKPFAFFLLTLDTHPPSGYPSSACGGIEFADGKSPMLNSFRCSDQLVGDFLRGLLASKLADNTIFVIASDHLAMNNDAYDRYFHNLEVRRNLYFILEKNSTPRSVDKYGSTLDLAPTLLSQLGVEIEAYNLGRNLFGDRQTIIEEFDEPDQALRSWNSNLADFY